MFSFKNDWSDLLASEFQKPYFQKLWEFVQEEYRVKTIYPALENIFNAFQLTPYQAVKVVILGQDPYHEPNQAMGLAFSVYPGQKLPPSLRNIYQELYHEYPEVIRMSGDLSDWADQGVLLLNTVLTVEAGKANSHKGLGWEKFTDAIIEKLNERQTPMVFILWGNDAKKKQLLITNPKHLVLSGVHPSPLSAHQGFFGCNHFKLANEFLKQNGQKEIIW